MLPVRCAATHKHRRGATMKDASIFDNIDPALLQKFKRYHHEHPEVFQEFKECAYKMREIKASYSAWTIINVIRWNFDIRKDEAFSINNDYIALYARLLIYHDADFTGFFELRKMKATGRKLVREAKFIESRPLPEVVFEGGRLVAK